MSKNVTVTMPLEEYEHMKAKKAELERVLQENWETQARRCDALFAGIVLPATLTDADNVVWNFARYRDGSVHLHRAPRVAE